MANCEICDAILKGKQKMYCSHNCGKKAWYHKNLKRSREINKKQSLRIHAGFKNFKENLGCSICGYNKCGAALEFHHLRDKLFLINANIYKSKRGKKELEKCILLCSNCHAELHYKEGM